MDEVAVIGMIRDGTADAFSVIVDHYQEQIFRYLYRLTGEYQLAQDLAQDTFVKAYEEILKTRDELNLKAWLYKIATNNAYKHFRRAKLVSFISFDHGGKTAFPQENNKPGDATEQLAVQEAIKSVPVEMRYCLVLHLVEGFKYREIAETLGISEDAVRMRVARGKEAFRRCYDGRKKQ
jgi:RNA polymerase sigma-70 factor (ECF subfamily)